MSKLVNRLGKKQSTNVTEYPSDTEIEGASDYQIRHWYNTLPSPSNEAQVDVMKKIIFANKRIPKPQTQPS